MVPAPPFGAPVAARPPLTAAALADFDPGEKTKGPPTDE